MTAPPPPPLTADEARASVAVLVVLAAPGAKVTRPRTRLLAFIDRAEAALTIAEACVDWLEDTEEECHLCDYIRTGTTDEPNGPHATECPVAAYEARR